MPSYSSYPTGSDLQAFLAGHGLDTTAYADQLDSMADAAYADFERDVHRKMLAETSSTRRYTPPTGREGILFVKDLASAPTVAYQPAGSSSETLVEGMDYWLEPENALEEGIPITRIRFRRRWMTPMPFALHQSLYVTGYHGYGLTLPANARLAMLKRGANHVWTHLTQGATGGVLGKKEGDASIDYGVESWARLRDAWSDPKNGYEAVVNQYVRREF